MTRQHKRLSSGRAFTMSRRGFGKGVLTAAAAVQSSLFDFASTLFADTTRAMPTARVHVVVVRPKEHGPHITWPGGQVDIVAMQKTFTKTLTDAAGELRVQLDVRPAPMATLDDVNAYLGEIKGNRPDGILVLAMELKAWRTIIDPLLAGRGDIPTIVYSNMSSFTQHQQSLRQMPNAILAATHEVDWLKDGLRMFHTMIQMKNTRIALVADKYKEKSPLSVWRWGPEFHFVAEKRWDEEIQKVGQSDQMRAVADHYANSAQQIVEPKGPDILRAVKVYVALRRIMEQEKCQGITCNCLPFATRTGDTACLPYCHLMDQGIVGCCEADLGGATLMHLSHLLLERPGFIQDPSPNTVNNTFIGSHCTSGLKLKGFNDPYRAPYLLRDYHVRSGVAVQVLWPVNEPVTIMEQAADSLLVGTGRVVSNIPNPPSKQWGGCRTTVEIRMDGVDDTRDVVGFHQFICCGDFQRTLQLYGKLVGIDVKPITARVAPAKSPVAAAFCPCRCCGQHA